MCKMYSFHVNGAELTVAWFHLYLFNVASETKASGYLVQKQP